jgi:hypothetical protein
MVSALLSVTFACGLFIAIAHVVNRRFIAPVYDVAANLIAFGSATAASALLGHWLPAGLSIGAIGCWLVLALRTLRVQRPSEEDPASTETLPLGR